MPKKATATITLIIFLSATLSNAAIGDSPRCVEPASTITGMKPEAGSRASLAPQSRFSLSRAKLDLNLPAGGLSTLDYLTIIERYIAGDDEGLGDFVDELAQRIEGGRWEDYRKRLWVFKEFFWERLADTKEPVREAQAFSRPFAGADGKAYKLRVKVLSNKLVELAIFNHESEVTIHGLKALISRSAVSGVSLEFLNKLTTFISAESIRNAFRDHRESAEEALTALVINEGFMNRLDTMVTSGARDFFEYAFQNKPWVFIGVLMAYPFDLEKQLQPMLNSIVGEIEKRGDAPSFYVKSGIILKAELAAIQMLDFRDMMISERSYLQGKVNPPSAAAINRRLRLLGLLTGIEVPANTEGVMANDFPLVGLEGISPEKCKRGMIKLAHDKGENECVAFLLKEKNDLIRDFKEERSRLWKWQRAMKRIASAREGLLRKHNVTSFDASIKERLSNSRFRRTLYAALEKLPRGLFEGAALTGFPHLRLHVKGGTLSVVISDPYDDTGATPEFSPGAAKKPPVIAYLSAFLKGEGSLNYIASALKRLMDESFVIFVDDLGIGAGKGRERDRLLGRLGIAAGCKSGNCILIKKGNSDLGAIYQQHISDKGIKVPVIVSDAADRKSLLGSGGGVADKCLLVVVEPPDEKARSVVAYKVCRIVNAILNRTSLPEVREVVLSADKRQLDEGLGGSIAKLSLDAEGLLITPVKVDKLYLDRLRLASAP